MVTPRNETEYATDVITPIDIAIGTAALVERKP